MQGLERVPVGDPGRSRRRLKLQAERVDNMATSCPPQPMGRTCQHQRDGLRCSYRVHTLRYHERAGQFPPSTAPVAADAADTSRITAKARNSPWLHLMTEFA